MSTDRIWIWFANNGNIRKWQQEPFAEGAAYVRVALSVDEAQVEEVARRLTKWLGHSWDGLGDGSVVDKGLPIFTHGQFGWGFQGRQDDMRALARELLTVAQEARHAD